MVGIVGERGRAKQQEDRIIIGDQLAFFKVYASVRPRQRATATSPAPLFSSCSYLPLIHSGRKRIMIGS